MLSVWTTLSGFSIGLKMQCTTLLLFCNCRKWLSRAPKLSNSKEQNACNKETEDQPSPFRETNALLFTDSVVSARESSCQRLHEGVGSSFVISSSTCLGCPGGAAAWDRGWGGSRNSVPSCLKCIKFVFEVCVGTCHF